MECIHRGSVHTQSPRGDVHRCKLFGTCSVNDVGLKKDGVPVRVCAACDQRTRPTYEAAATAFDRVVIINLARRTDRLQEIVREIEKGWPFAEPVVMNAVDGEKVRAPEGYKQGNNVWACLQSHRRAIEDAINDGMKSVLVLEDDAVLDEGFADKALKFMTDIPDDWEFAFLGGHHYRKAPIHVKPGITRPQHMDRMHAYAARGQGLIDLYRFWHQWHDGHCDHAISTWITKRKTYCVQPWIIGQGGGPSDVQRANGDGHQIFKAPEWWIAADHAILEKPPEPVRPVKPPVRPPSIPIILEGVGAEVSKILKSIGIETNGCQGCNDMILRMNAWGVEGCETNREAILRRLRMKAQGTTWATKFKAAAGAVMTGLAMKVNWTDPCPGILDEGIRIVREREAKPDTRNADTQPPSPISLDHNQGTESTLISSVSAVEV